MLHLMFLFFFFFNDTATTEIYTLSLHDALPIYGRRRDEEPDLVLGLQLDVVLRVAVDRLPRHVGRGGLDPVLDDGLHLVGQRVELRLVEGDLELLGVLVVALRSEE